MLAKTDKKIRRVGFFGDATARIKDEHFQEAYMVAKLLAETGYIVVNGGGPGVMLAATLGAKEAGGKVEVVILDPKKEPGNFEGTDKENLRLADKKYVTSSYKNRVDKLIEIADAFVIFKGGTGTLSELGLVWEYAKFNFGKHEPIIFVGKCWENIVADLIKDLGLEKMEQRVVAVMGSPEEVVGALKRCQEKK